MNTLTPEGKELFRKMGEWCMRLVVPVGDRDIFLISDPRFHHIPDYCHEREAVSKGPVIELVRKGLVCELTPYQNGYKVGWREMFKGHEAVIPEGAKVYAPTQ